MKPFISKRFFEVSIIFHFRRLIYHTRTTDRTPRSYNINSKEMTNMFYYTQNECINHQVLSYLTLGKNQFLRLNGFLPPFFKHRKIRAINLWFHQSSLIDSQFAISIFQVFFEKPSINKSRKSPKIAFNYGFVRTPILLIQSLEIQSELAISPCCI